MLEHNNNINVHDQEHILCMRDDQGNIPLHNAIRNHRNLSSVLLMNTRRETMLFENDATQSPLSIAVDTGSTYIAWFIMKKNPSSLDYRGPNNFTVLHYAVINQNYVSVVEIVHRNKELIQEVDEHKRNPLHYAADLGYVAIARVLLEAAASSSVAYDRGCNGQTPLHLAAKYGQRDILRLILIDYSNSIEVVDEMKRNILHLAALNGKEDIVRFILRLPEIEDLINSPDVDENIPMHLAILNFHNNVFDILSRNDKVNKGATNSTQQTALAIAWSSEDPKLDIKKADLRDMAQVVLVMATIIVTFTFIAALTLPGGYKDEGPHEGTAKLVGNPGFKTFVVSITIAMTSALAVAFLALRQIRYKNHNLFREVDLMSRATILVYSRLLSMSVAFMTGFYVVLYTNLGLAMMVISFSCAFPNMVILLAPAFEVETYLHKLLVLPSFFLLIVISPLQSLLGLVVVFAGRPLACKLLYLLESTYIRWYDRQIEYTLNSSRRMVHVCLVLALLGMLRDSARTRLLKSNRGQHTPALELASTINKV